ncbi:hypothetical protein [Corallococcus llansteffanensis]|uniref:Peptidase C39-like domain-containing protein n=1 Tax=Corallococcus llansteffanensis TaxID=2316731 RepID=A0A3A8NQI9_9BACT|nr:hypothetical protein [Corallococcus llansteffanensis]RKH46498.1 hypothetical protein D7V93_34695 [Corallococcus llansteffanensis]
MSVNLSSNLRRPFEQRAEATPAAQPQQTAQQLELPQEKVVARVESARTPQQVEQATDAYAAVGDLMREWSSRFQAGGGASAQEPGFSVGPAGAPEAPEIGGWETEGSDSSVLKQTKQTNCGAAVAVMLSKDLGTGKTQSVSDTQKMDALESRFTDGKGTSPHELSNMLANQGLKVTQTSAGLDKDSLDQALARGGKAAVMVDSCLVDPTTKEGETGLAHWVSVEGKDDQGRYLLKDPSTGTRIPVDAQRLADSMQISWAKHQGGGMMLVENANGIGEPQAAAESGQKVASMGNTDGVGSRAQANFGRESS